MEPPEDVILEHMERQREHLRELLARPEKECDVDAESLVVEDLLGVVLVTSALPIHPSTEMIEAVLATHQKQEPALERAVKIIVCDHPKAAPLGASSQYKSGRLLEEDTLRYAEYCDALERLSAEGRWPWGRCRVVRRAKYGGFGMCLKEGLTLLKTRFVLVLQHDRILLRPFDARDVLATLLARPAVRYVGLASNSSVNCEPRYRSMGIPVHTAKRTTRVHGRQLVPLPFWYDATHVADVAFYLETVFGWHAFEGTRFARPFRLKTGDFPEDKLGNAFLAYIRVHGMQVHPLFGCFLLDDGETIYCRHVHGRKITASSQRQMSQYVTAEDVAENEQNDDEE